MIGIRTLELRAILMIIISRKRLLRIMLDNLEMDRPLRSPL